MSKHDKTYDVTLTLGQTSATGDSEGPLTPVSDVVPTEEAVRAALAKFTGDLLQTPPAFSAKSRRRACLPTGQSRGAASARAAACDHLCQ